LPHRRTFRRSIPCRGAQSVAEDTILPIAGVSVADSDSSALTTTLNVSSGTLHVSAGAGVSGNGTASVTIAGTAAQINTALAGLTCTGNLNFNGADTLTVTTNDGTAIDTDTIAITVNAVNDAPVNTVPGAQSVAEDTALPIASVSVADVDSSALTTTLNVSSGTLRVTAGAGVSGNDTASVTITGTAAQINTALAGLSYTGNLDFNGADTLTVATSDTIATDTDTIAITVNAVNDAPVNTVPGAQSVAEDTLLSIAGVSVTDVDSSALTTTLSVSSGTLHVSAGAGVSGNDTASVTITGTAAQINTALAGLSYTGNLDFNGADTLTVATSDGTATDTDTIAITVNAVNDAPALIVAANAGFVENALPVLLSPSASLTDLDDTNLEFASVQITDGSFSGDGDVLTVGGLTSGTVTGITFTWDATLHALVFNGTSSVANYQALLQTVGFQSTSNNPTDFGTSRNAPSHGPCRMARTPRSRRRSSISPPGTTPHRSRLTQTLRTPRTDRR
jgi:VCBS repeat-containing protein